MQFTQKTKHGTGAMILVYEHASKGSLQNYLGSSDKMNLTWVQRLNICLDIAHGLNYIHNNTDHGKQKMIHRDVKSDNILLGDNWKAKIADFGLSKFHPADQVASTIYTDTIAGTKTYMDPEYQEYGRLNKKSDIYSFGVVLLEILTGKLAYDSVYTTVNERGIAPIARDHFQKRTIMKIVDHKIKEETDENVFSLSKGPNKESLDIFLEIAIRCVAETQEPRPRIEIVIKELKKAINCQENHKDNLKLSLEDVKLDKKIVEREARFATELEILMEYKHENVIGLVGYCAEEEEKIIVYQYASRGSLDKYLSDDSFTWVMRLKVCIEIATGLEFLHGTVSSQEMVIHRDINSSNILLFNDWKAKISNFGLSLICPKNQIGDSVIADYLIDNITGTIGYRDPLHSKTGFLTKESDIFSLGAVLFDITCGKISSVELDEEYLYLPFLAKSRYQVGKLDELVFEGIKEQIVPQSFAIFSRIAYQCLDHRREKRPTVGEVEDYEIWEPKLPKDYKEIIQMSKCPEIYSTKKKEDLYKLFSEGILLQQDKVLLSFDGDGDRNELVSAKMFTYVNSCAHKWRSLTESRFETVVEMLDISNLNIGIKADTHLLSPNVVYGVYLVFKFCNSRNFTTGPMANYEMETSCILVGLSNEKLLVLSAKATLYNFFKVDLFTSKPSAYSRFQEEIELLPQQVFYLKCTISSQMLSPGTEYACYLLFNVSEEYQGLHNPVKVRDILHQENKEAEFFVYFITPSELNIHDFTRVPKQREDGWMEIQVWKFNSTHEFEDDSLSIDMKFTSPEGNMSGIICRLDEKTLTDSLHGWLFQRSQQTRSDSTAAFALKLISVTLSLNTLPSSPSINFPQHFCLQES
ncbi:kinase-like domain, phloem protein 2-like protein [Tanacetum coccineum]